MSSFGEVLKQCIEDQGISVNAFAKDTGINRGWLYNIFTGVKKLPEEKFHAMLRDFDFTAANEDLLYEAYYREVFGGDAYENIMFIADFFSKGFTESCAMPLQPAEEFVRPVACISAIDAKDFIGALNSVVREEIETAAAPVIYTNFPFRMEQADNCIYLALRASGKPAVLKHLVRFERKSHSKNNLRNVLHSLRYLLLRQNVHYFYSDSVSAEFGGILYPYFVVTPTGALLFDFSGARSLFIHQEEEALAQLCSQAVSLFSGSEPLADYPDSVLELKDLVEPSGATGITDYLYYYPCWTQFADAGLLEQIISPGIPFRNGIIQIADRYYSAILRCNPNHYFTLGGLTAFVEDGRFYESPEAVVPPFTKALRIYVLEKLIERLKGPVDRLFLLDERKITLPENLEVTYCNGSVLILLKLADIDDPYIGQCSVALDDKSIAADFRNFLEYIRRGQLIHTKDFALRALSDLLIICREKAEENKSE